MRRRRIVLPSIFAVLLVCNGCIPDRAILDPFSFAPATPQSVWKPKKAPARHTASLDKELPAEDIPLSLAEVLDVALKNNTQTRVSWAQARAAAASYAQSQSNSLPQVSGTYTYTRFRTASPLDVGTTNFDPIYVTQWGPDLYISYLLFDFGQLRATSEAAHQALYFSDWSHNRMIQTVIQTVTSDYYNYLYQQQLLAAYTADMETAKVTLEAAELELKSGIKDLSDVLQAKTQLLQAQITWVGQQKEVQKSFAVLATDMGLPSNFTFEVQDFPDTPPSDDMIESVNDLLALALEKRPDLIAAEANLKSKEWSVTAAQREYWPNLQFNFDYGQQSSHLQGITGSDKGHFTGTLTLNIPLFAGFFYQNGIRLAEANKAQAEADLRQKQLNVVKDVTTAHEGAKVAFDTLHYADDYLKASQKQYQVAIRQYRAGTKTILDVVSAQSSLADARAKQASAIQGWFTSLATLTYATGMIADRLLPVSEEGEKAPTKSKEEKP